MRHTSVSLNVHLSDDATFETTVRELNTDTVVLNLRIDNQDVSIFFKDLYQLSTWYASVKEALLGSTSPARS